MADVEITESLVRITRLSIPSPATRRQMNDLMRMADTRYLAEHEGDPHLRDGVPYDDAWTIDYDGAGRLVIEIPSVNLETR